MVEVRPVNLTEPGAVCPGRIAITPVLVSVFPAPAPKLESPSASIRPLLVTVLPVLVSAMRPTTSPPLWIVTTAGAPAMARAGPPLLDRRSPMVTVAPVPDVTLMPASAPETGAPALVMTVTLQALEALMP